MDGERGGTPRGSAAAGITGEHWFAATRRIGFSVSRKGVQKLATTTAFRSHREQHTHLILSFHDAQKPAFLGFYWVSVDCGGVKHEAIGMGTQGAIGLSNG